MHERDKYKSVKIEYGHLVDQIKNKSQDDWIKVCEKLDILVSTSYGNGSHATAYKNNCPPSNRDCCILTIAKNLYPNIQRDLFKKLLSHGLETGLYSEIDLWKALGIKLK